MINADTLSAPALNGVVRKLIPQLSKLYLIEPSLAGAANVELGETFTRWGLRRAVDDVPRPASASLRKIGYWHQLAFDGVAKAYAHSLDGTDDTGVPDIAGFGVSPLVPRIADAIAWLDGTATVDGVVRLVDIPSHQFIGFWIAGREDHVVTIHAGDPLLQGLLPLRTVHRFEAMMAGFREFRRQVPMMAP